MARKNSQNNLSRDIGGNILVVCFGNIFRSPFVEKRLSQLLPADKFTVRSAGFFDRTGRSCVPEFISLTEEFGVSLIDHRSKKVSMADLDWADLIVIMDRKNWDSLREMGADVDRKIVWVGSYLDGKLPEVNDPYGLSESDIRIILSRLNNSAEGIAKALGWTGG